MSGDIIFLPDCREENYEALRRVLVDADNIAPTCKGFCKMTESAEQHFRTEGRTVKRIDIDADLLIRQCRLDSHLPNIAAMQRLARFLGIGRHA